VSRGVRARDRQRHRERAHALLKDVPTRYLIDEVVARFGIRMGEIRLQVKNSCFASFETTESLALENLKAQRRPEQAAVRQEKG
jgi:hypothetical protein